MAVALILAAGLGERLRAGRPKAFVELAGRPLLLWSVDVLASVSAIERIVVALPAGVEAPAGTIGVRGGTVRSESVRLALAAAGEGDPVLVHDAARPLLTAELVQATLRAVECDHAVEYGRDGDGDGGGSSSSSGGGGGRGGGGGGGGDDARDGRGGSGAGDGALGLRVDAAIAATPVTDTVKQADEDCVVARTLDRAGLWAVQTPQVFRRDVLERALDVPKEMLAQATDDAWLVERAGGRVVVVPAPPENLKVTTPLDLDLAELVLARRQG